MINIQVLCIWRITFLMCSWLGSIATTCRNKTNIWHDTPCASVWRQRIISLHYTMGGRRWLRSNLGVSCRHWQWIVSSSYRIIIVSSYPLANETSNRQAIYVLYLILSCSVFWCFVFGITWWPVHNATVILTTFWDILSEIKHIIQISYLSTATR